MADELEEFTTPWRRDLEELGPALERWARHAIGPGVAVSDVASPGNGMSSETVLFSLQRDPGTEERYAARLAPLPELHPVFPNYDLDVQKRCMDLVRTRTDVPAPDVRYSEPDPEWLGTPFLVMARIDGDAPPDMPPYVFGGWLLDASSADRRRLQDASVGVLARVHELTPERADLSFLDAPRYGTTPLDQHLGYQHWFYDWAREGVSYPLIERALAWLERHRPEAGPTVLSWGDARIGNILFRDFEPVGVLDWEMAALGPAEVDLAWMIFLHRFFDDLAARFEMPGMPDFMERATIAATYEDLSGHTVRDLEWFEVLAALRFAVISVRTSARAIAYGTMEHPADPDDLVMFRGLLEQMLDGSYWR